MYTAYILSERLPKPDAKIGVHTKKLDVKSSLINSQYTNMQRQ